jgi:hypothetical protein
MATNMIPGDRFRWRHACYGRDQVGLNNWDFTVSVITNTPTYEGVLNSIDLAASVLYRPCIPAAFTRYGSQLIILTSPMVAPISTSANALAGLATGDTLTMQAAGLVSKRTGLRGRAGRGRCYIPFPSTDFLDTDGTPTAAYVALLTGIAFFFCTNIVMTDGAGNSAICVPQVSHGAGLTGSNITSYQTPKRWATQRRRGNFGRTNPPPW